ncbi:MAG: hypothetical protein A2821_02940 [Candidatus Magasanikbacteria bacterium RIFCSPHIGHO2_01_FULL_41_23]|uniref:Glycosyl transferase family 1 domain-containing protein n=1 Tax=Candidatus Magasanikbacteria bacterium RIFCSPLOWO2_01_FULL_40_15 TaxID=1798686 RepID=A0A1F6N3C6_9BACT|nr:MAG: hypothetical protein A2821_02940 [Candidatus Magasanikbacteria bacterium RIFCSPHIGHO2_01_FULL_41_23]OGH67294.1 MAG: hypothetical protein A3C66_00955 [Candidatus Magasanikbacteria bacterium RIFCSPHIGHO2_02_FULL_41_35]OGH76519.1 MAG: hypothetical protein A3F22_00165 [Candidatus Magasanikbacteria bacterium RIFCSPHIGHO2_12_FULL_41_16]OGH78495.1 MAG: hypothetical protein A2983_03190 [Candidatus Magasanikbacteria bacterium RIFCSPLOWO2_01_FULL_40_15]
MKLLVITQKVDKNDSNLGFFHAWLEKIAQRVDYLYVICLEKGEYSLPENVTVLSLGKEENRSRLKYLWRFYFYIFKYEKEYDGVLVHMNPEYIVLGGWLWRLWQKKVLLWYTHKSVDLKLKIAEKLVTKIFTASKESFRLKSNKVEIVGHGINVAEFWSSTSSGRAYYDQNLVLKLITVGRIAPAKDLETIIKAVVYLIEKKSGLSVSLDIIGEAILPQDIVYQENLKNKYAQFSQTIKFLGKRNHQEMPKEYQSHQLFVHSSKTGSVDKVVLEALASGCPVVTSGEAYADAVQQGVVFVFPIGDYKKLAEAIEKTQSSGILNSDKLPNVSAIEYVRKNHNLDLLINRIQGYFSQK